MQGIVFAGEEADERAQRQLVQLEGLGQSRQAQLHLARHLARLLEVGRGALAGAFAAANQLRGAGANALDEAEHVLQSWRPRVASGLRVVSMSPAPRGRDRLSTMRQNFVPTGTAHSADSAGLWLQ